MGKQKILVAVHGMGQQFRHETVRAVAEQVCRMTEAVRVVPLGAFHLDGGQKAFRFAEPPQGPRISNCDVGFAEIYWADIPREVVRDGYTLESIKSWGKSLAVRIDLRKDGSKLNSGDIDALKEVLPELVEAISVIETGLRVLSMAKLLPSYDIMPVLTDYMGDVQLVTEYPSYRTEILDRFQKAVEGICEENPEAEIYFVAHSEGSVVAFLGLLRTLSESQNASRIRTQIRGFMTFGSPIDKHLLLWPELWNSYRAKADCIDGVSPAIKWKNYYDLGDPVGFSLNTTRAWLADSGWDRHFAFRRDDDIEFTRYPLPGIAHIRYWQDDAVFDDFVRTVVEEPVDPETAEKVGVRARENNPRSQQCARLLPYAIAVALITLASYLLFKGIAETMETKGATSDLAKNVAILSAFLSGITLAARYPRFVKPFRYRAIAVVLGTLLCVPIMVWPLTIYTPARDGSLFPTPFAEVLQLMQEVFAPTPGSFGARFVSWAREVLDPLEKVLRGVPVRVGLAISLCAFISWLMSRYRFRLRALVIPAAAIVLVVHLLKMVMARDGAMSLWPVILGGAAFVYLWWLAALVLDTTIVWHQYIRNNHAMVLLRRCLRHDWAADEQNDETE